MESSNDWDTNTNNNKNITESSEFIINNWDDFDIHNDLLRGIYGIGFEKPSPIQKKAIPHILSGKDIIAQAQSGTGKTGTFSIGTLQLINVNEKRTQAILMAPTHELASQSSNVISKIWSMMKGLTIKTFIGGTSVNEDIEYLKKNTPHIIVGTPGRIYDMIKREYINTSYLKIFVMDEADDMLSNGFKEQIYNIFQHFPENIQVALFSATIPIEIMDITRKFMRNPVQIRMNNEELNLECIQQYFVALSSDHAKYDILKKLFEYLNMSQCIIYVNSITRVNDLYAAMTAEGFSVCAIHSSMTKKERDIAFKNFKSGTYRILISSNVTARGIDIQQVSIVINFDIPRCVHTYLHRIGRSGRWGRKGVAINFITRNDIHYMKAIENHYKSNIEELPMDGDIQNILNR